MACAHAANGFYSSGQDSCTHHLWGTATNLLLSPEPYLGVFCGSVKWPRPESSQEQLE